MTARQPLLAARLERLGVCEGRFALALSGGPDSMALLHKLKPDIAFIVDHGLRPESATEAAQVNARAEALGVPAKILRWEGKKPTTGIMKAARQARYELLLEACHQSGFTHLFLAHHQDDQIETYLMRKERGSGWRGLAGMPWLAERAGVTLVRPLLDVPKPDLLAYCERERLDYVDDPSNRNPAYTRSRIREEVKQADRADILAEMFRNAMRRQQELDSFRMWMDKHAHFTEGGAVWLDEEPDTALFSQLLHLIGQSDYAPDEGAVPRLLQASAGATLAGCKVWRTKNALWVAREAGAILPLEIRPGKHDMLWDRRLRLSFAADRAFTLKPLGQGAWRRLEGAEWIEALPGPVRAGLPALWEKGALKQVLRGRRQQWHDPFAQNFLGVSEACAAVTNG